MNSKNLADAEEAHQAHHNVMGAVIANTGDRPDPVLRALPDPGAEEKPGGSGVGQAGRPQGRPGAVLLPLTSEQRSEIARVAGGLGRNG